MKEKTRTCQSCKQDFVIAPEDFTFYEKIKVPPPTQCPDCRRNRRLAWLKGLKLYKHICDLCGKEHISMYPTDTPYTVYCQDCWWSDKWNPEDYGRDFDFNRPFFEQFDEHMKTVPLMGLAVSQETSKLCPFTNHCDSSKNCYLTFYSAYNEDCAYGFYLSHDKGLLDCCIVWECENCYDSINAFRSNRVHGSVSNVHNSVDSYFLKDCKNANNCFGGANLRNKQYIFFGEQFTKDEYKKKVAEIDLGSYKTYVETKARAEELWKSAIPHPAYDHVMTQNCTGSYIFFSKNCIECYDSGYCEDCKYVMLLKNPDTKDCYDYIDWGENAERIYEGITVGQQVADVKFSQDIHSSHDVEYSKSCMNSSNLFACIGMRSKDHAIFNKRYSKEEFKELRGKIVKHMKENKEYGEFFPMWLSPHDYNDSFAHVFSPLKKKEAERKGLTWMDSKDLEHDITIKSSDLPDHVKDAPKNILDEVISCSSCPRGYKIIPWELQFLKQYNFPLPRQCPFCRIGAKISFWVQRMTLRDRVCDNCSKDFRLPYTKEQAPKVYCKDCYFEEVV
jgi:hypothetical protein